MDRRKFLWGVGGATVLGILNHPLARLPLRSLLAIPNHDISLWKPLLGLGPNYIITDSKPGQFTATFFGRPKYANLIAKKRGVINRLGRIFGPSQAWADSFGPYYPDADPETTTVDGICRSYASTWANVMTGADLSALPSQAESTVIQCDYLSDPAYQMTRAFFLFDTHLITSGYVVSVATLSFYYSGTGLSTATNPANIQVVSSNPTSNTNLVTGDYALTHFGTTGFLDTPYSIATFIASSGYKDLSLNASGCANVQVGAGAITKFGVRAQTDMDNQAPDTGTNYSYSYAKCYMADNGSNEPKLTVTANAPVGNLNGIW